jgi:hypothetical protein
MKAAKRTRRGSLEAPIDILKAFKLREKPLEVMLIYGRRKSTPC